MGMCRLLRIHPESSPVQVQIFVENGRMDILRNPRYQEVRKPIPTFDVLFSNHFIPIHCNTDCSILTSSQTVTWADRNICIF